MKIDIHNYNRQVELAFVRLKRARLRSKNRQLIREYVDFRIANGLSSPRVAKYIDVLRYWGKWLYKDFDTLTREDITPVVTKLQLGKHSAWTKQAYKIMFKKFFQWVKQADEYPPEVNGSVSA